MSYNWSSDQGFSSNQKIVNVSQAGNYVLSATNPTGLTKSKGFNVTLNDFDLKAEFLVSTVVNAGDSVYVIDVTKPTLPSINWILPTNNVSEISTSTPNVKRVVFNSPSIYQISMVVYSGGFEDIITKTVTVLEKSNKAGVSDALGYNAELIDNIKLFPNPTNGQFNVDVSLSKIANVKASFLNPFNNQIIETKLVSGSDIYNLVFNHPNLPPGIYFVAVAVGDVVKTLKLVII